MVITVDQIQQQLQKFPIFKELSSKKLGPIIEIAQVRFYKSKMYAFMQGDPIDRVFFIQSGKVKIYKSDMTGREQIVSVLEAGEMFPHAGFFRKGQYPAHAEMIEDTQLIVIPIVKFEEILVSNPELSITLFKLLGEKLVDLQARLEEQILHNAYEQIIMLLLRLCRTNGEKRETGFTLTTHFTNRELASMIGTSRETVSRTINYLKKKDYLQLNDEGFYLIDHEKLHQELLVIK